jgi:anti-sigma B factor antagonist
VPLPSDKAFSVITDIAGGVVVIRLHGELDLATAPELSRALDDLPEDGPGEIIVDFSQLAFIDSSGIAALIAAQKALVARGRHLSIRFPRPAAFRVLEITGLLAFLHVGPSASEDDLAEPSSGSAPH